MAAAHRFEALIDGVLVRAREGREDKLAGVWVARMDRQSIAMLGDLLQRLDIRDIKAGIDSLREHIQGEGDDMR
jgi:hypothetical protein